LLAGKIVFNFGQSTIGCVVREISEHGAMLQVENPLGVPKHFHLVMPDQGSPRPCKMVWQSDRQLGLEFETPSAAKTDAPEPVQADSLMRGSMLALRAAFDEIEIGIVLLDGGLRAQFINRAFRRMWNVSDELAATNPSFIALMYHGRKSRAYQVLDEELDAYVAERVRLVQAGEAAPVNLRRSDGEVLQMQCAALPNGGRMLSYTTITEIVRRSDELEGLRNALEHVDEGIVLLDSELRVDFLNQKMRRFWDLTPEQAAMRPAYADLVARAARAYDHGSAPFDVKSFVAKRVAAVKNSDASTHDLRTADGRHIRVNCVRLENDGRMITYCDVSDLVRNAEQLEKLATVDSMTGLFNRGHFLSLSKAEWSRFQRYYRPLSVLMIDIDHFKTVNDRFGHAVGDEALVSVANACLEGRRASDILGRMGGEEFAMLLPETDLYQARTVAERIRESIASRQLTAHKDHFNVTASIGFAAATVSMAGFEALLSAADQALYQAKSRGRNCTVAWDPPSAPKLAAE
jgi:diguanylate cyclase (GGDEF)-like protein